MRLFEQRYRTVNELRGQLLILEGVRRVRMGEVVEVVPPDGPPIAGEVLLIAGTTVVVQLFADPGGLDCARTTVLFSDTVKQAPLTPALLNRVFSGGFSPLDGLPQVVPERWAPISGQPINPVKRERPSEFIETGFSVIDGLATLVKGQKLPIFTGAGLPAPEFVARILAQARTREDSGFALVFVALGLTHHEHAFYMEAIRGIASDFVAFINLADDPVVERLQAPRLGVTVAEYLAFELGRDVLVVITDMVNYCDALREIASLREELPGRRGYPGYLYSDLASIYERAGRIKEGRGSVTMLPVVTLPEDDITHPIPDLTGYITEGQLVLSRELDRRGIFPPVDVLPSLSRLMQQGIGEGLTRCDHREVANRLYSGYAKGRELRSLEVVVGREGISEDDRRFLDFALRFEEEFVHQPKARRTVDQTLDLGRALLERFRIQGQEEE